MTVTIALDCMGGDHGAPVTVSAALRFLEREPEVRIVLVGRGEVLEAELRRHRADTGERLRVQTASEIVEMDEPPAQALRGKRDSSMRIAIDLVKDGEADACVSAGNTGALMAISRFVLKMLPGIERPAIASFLPTLRGRTCVLDLGACIAAFEGASVRFRNQMETGPGGRQIQIEDPDGNPIELFEPAR